MNDLDLFRIRGKGSASAFGRLEYWRNANMTTYYATNDAEDGKILQDAFIVKFDTLDEAREYLARQYDSTDWNLDTMEIGVGRYGDCWVKTMNEPRADISDRWLTPFTLDEMTVERPGQHPGGKMYWTTPTIDVLVITSITMLASHASDTP